MTNEKQNNSMGWDEYFCSLIAVVAKKSKDPTTKHGCVIVGPEHEIRSTGYNGMPRGVDDNIPARSERPEKYLWFEHAERNAIYNAARNGTPLSGCVLYITGWPCVDCTRALIQVGIKGVIIHDLNIESTKERWGDSIKRSKVMLEETGVFVCEIK